MAHGLTSVAALMLPCLTLLHRRLLLLRYRRFIRSAVLRTLPLSLSRSLAFCTVILMICSPTRSVSP